MIVTDLSVNRLLLNACVSGYLKLVNDFIAALYNNTVTTRYLSPIPICVYEITPIFRLDQTYIRVNFKIIEGMVTDKDYSSTFKIILVIQGMIMMIALMKEHQLPQTQRKDQAITANQVIPAVKMRQIATMVIVNKAIIRMKMADSQMNSKRASN